MADYNVASDYGAELDAILASVEEEAGVTADAHERYGQVDAYQSRLKSKYQRYHHYYAPTLNGDQWPEDLSRRPGKIHATLNVIKPAVNIDGRIQALIPRLTHPAEGLSEQQRIKAESGEKLMLEWLKLSDWEVWLGVFTRVRSLYGKGILKVFWNKDTERPDVIVVENPANLRIGWGSSDYRVMDWALYEYAISPQEAMIRFPGLIIKHSTDGRTHLQLSVSSDHSDPLNQSVPLGDSKDISRPTPYQPSDYEQQQVRIWDYWYKKPNGKGGFTVCNAMFAEGVLVKPAGAKKPVMEHKYLPDIPYIVVPEDVEPGSPEGISSIEDLIDLQIELNRAVSHWMQLIADEVDPAWVLEGDNADSVPPGLVPKANQIVPAGTGNHILPLAKDVQTFPISELINAIWDHYHKISGLSEITFGELSGAQVSGRATAIQIESTQNRIDPRRKLLYSGLKRMLLFWVYMAEKINPKIYVGDNPDTGEPMRAGVKEIIGGLTRWEFIAPEITPRDVYENTQNEINKVGAKLSSIETSMDQLGIDAPVEELQRIMRERMNAQLFPADVQAYVSLLPIIQQVQMQQMQMQQQLSQIPQGAGPVGPGGAPPGGNMAQAQSALGAQQMAQYAAQPQAVGEDQNQQPLTQAGSPPPAAGQGPVGPVSTTLIRGGQAMNQLYFKG